MEKTTSSQVQKLKSHIWIIFVLGFSLTSLASFYFYRDSNKELDRRMERAANRIIESIQIRLHQHELALIQAKAFLMHEGAQINNNIFQEYLKNSELMDIYPGMQALAFVRKFSPDEIPGHLKERRKEHSDYKIWPPTEDPDLTSIVYIAPMNWRNTRAVGFNMMTEPVRRAAMEKARDSGRAALSRKLILMQEINIDPQPGFILYVPIYKKAKPQTVSERREHLFGYVTSPFRIRDFISAVVGKTQTGGMDFKIYSDDSSLIYHHGWHSGDKKNHDSPDLIRTMSIGEYFFKIHFFANSEMRSSNSHNFSIVLGCLGLLLTLLLMRLLYITQKQIGIKQSALNARDEFLSIASHELKTPITSLQLQLEMVKRRVHPENGLTVPPQKLLNSLDNSIYQVNRVTRLIDDLLEISKIENGKQTYYFNKTDLSELISHVCDSHAHQIANVGSELKLNLPKDLMIECDRFKLEQVISNILTNAIKYGGGTTIEVDLRKEKDRAIISIKDKGPGIPEELQAKIFERFERVTSNKTVTGLGLGLYISKQIVIAHRGSIIVKSEPEKGSEFIVNLPLTQSQA